jgi:hypothetical protein
MANGLGSSPERLPLVAPVIAKMTSVPDTHIGRLFSRFK